LEILSKSIALHPGADPLPSWLGISMMKRYFEKIIINIQPNLLHLQKYELKLVIKGG
jgi:hypothetical protein